jgi:hypothetical protein
MDSLKKDLKYGDFRTDFWTQDLSEFSRFEF